MTVKRRRVSGEEVQRLKMVARGFYFPKKNPKKPQGDDAHFICEEEGTMGVADGVGGWVSCGIDAGEYARSLMKRAAVAVKREPKGYVNLERVLKEAFAHTKEKGSSTACIVTLKERVLHVVNVGDSGLIVFRKHRLLFRSPIQQRRFNTPYQLGNGEGYDRPKAAAGYRVQVEPGDIVVLGTDGLWDNMFVHEIEWILDERNADTSLDVEYLASTIAKTALKLSMEKQTDGPFAVAAQKVGRNRQGGKSDDITVVVVRIDEKSHIA